MSAQARPAALTLAAYDELPYDCLPIPQTHPSRLATIARLFGLAPPGVDSCRVLELGCANGNNLIPMAAALPGARFLGIDLSRRQIADGQRNIDAAGLANIELRHADIASIGARDGQFDYIIAHGVYSWVPADVRDKVLAICSENLAPNGVAYVSYNTYPGWGVNGVLREMMTYHARGTSGARTRARKGRAMLDVLGQAMPNTPYGAVVREEIAFLNDVPDGYLSHDHLEGCNDPVYFHQFAEAAGRCKLQYLAEAEFSTMGLGGLPPQALAAMRSVSSDLIAFEQLTDIVRCRAHRQTLLVHQHAPIDRRLGSASIQSHSIWTQATLPPVEAAKPVTTNSAFIGPNGSAFNLGNPLTRAALKVLIERSPEAVGFDQLHLEASNLLRAATVAVPGLDAGRSLLAGELLQFYAAGIVQLRTWEPQVTANVSERPLATKLARLQAGRGSEVASQLHQSVALNPAERSLLGLLDGTRDVPALADAMTRAGALPQPAAGGTRGTATVERVRAMLRQLAKLGLLAKGLVISLVPDVMDLVPFVV